MPTTANRNERLWEARLTIAGVIAVVVLAVLGFVRLYQITHTLQSQQATTCALRHAGRASENSQVREPLRQAFQYLGDLIVKGAAQQPNAAKRAQSLAAGRHFQAYAARVQLLSNPPC